MSMHLHRSPAMHCASGCRASNLPSPRAEPTFWLQEGKHRAVCHCSSSFVQISPLLPISQEPQCAMHATSKYSASHFVVKVRFASTAGQPSWTTHWTQEGSCATVLRRNQPSCRATRLVQRAGWLPVQGLSSCSRSRMKGKLLAIYQFVGFCRFCHVQDVLQTSLGCAAERVAYVR